MSNLSKLLTQGATLVQQGGLVGACAEFEKAAREHFNKEMPPMRINMAPDKDASLGWLGAVGNVNGSWFCRHIQYED